jgi:hypothetical protein
MNRVFCIGLSRTGTTSLCEALNMLGINTIHYPSILFAYPEVINSQTKFIPQRKISFYGNIQLKKELKALNKKNPSSFLDKYMGFGDLPIPLLYKELDKRFPGSKFIFTTRNEEKWLNSMKWMFQEGRIIWKWGRIDDEILHQTYGTICYEKEKLLARFREYHDEVLMYFAKRPEDLLLLNIDDNKIEFKDICPFLNLKTPNENFPSVNNARKVSLKQKYILILLKNIPFLEFIIYKLKKILR